MNEAEELMSAAILSRRVISDACVTDWCPLEEAGCDRESLERYLQGLYGCDPDLHDPGHERGVLLEDRFDCQYLINRRPL